MSRQYFEDLLAEPPIANLTAVTATVETGLWNVAQYTPIAAGDPKPGRIYRVTAGGIVTFASTGTLTITPRFGTSTGGVTLGASVAQTVPGVVTNAPWILDFTMVVRTVGAPGTNSTVIGTGTFSTNGTGTAGTSVSVNFGGTSGTVDVSVASGIFIGWTLTVAGSVTPQYCFIQSLN
jgi:hypothetical protein